MTLHVEPFCAEHWARLRVQPAQSWCLPWMGPDLVAWLAGLEAYTAFAADTPVAIAGLMELWPGRSLAWSYLSEAAGPHLVSLTRLVDRFLDLRAPRRTEAYVDEEFEAGHRWMHALGFEREGFLRAFKPDGGNQIMYARLRNG